MEWENTMEEKHVTDIKIEVYSLKHVYNMVYTRKVAINTIQNVRLHFKYESA